MQTINQESNSNSKPGTSDTVTLDNSCNTLDKIIESGHLLTVDEQATLRRVLGRFCSKRIKKIIREKLAAPTIQWGNSNAYRQVLFLGNGEIKFIASESYRKELSVCRKELIGNVDIDNLMG